ncbi:maestro heat-like repeat-containing protein family member 9 [Sciurus carolinensis]|uniref:maestro heat-like repeat-containing protein family member 9 n=1 Tax=Sciurus carolinensis TaxID=30640 RepID=UPI001FB3159E|nr:maestro heat-like repeat-containing protein family member 9 [Sciurus carolinensis]
MAVEDVLAFEGLLCPSTQEHEAYELWNVYADLLCHQSIILAINSSFVDPILQYEVQLKITESSFRMLFALPSFEKLKALGIRSEDFEDQESLYQNSLHIFEDTLLILVSKDLYKLQLLREMTVWMHQERWYLQEEAMSVISRVLGFASKKVTRDTSVDVPCLGVLAAELALLCNHTDNAIVYQAAMGMFHLLCMAKWQNDPNSSIEHEKSEENGIKSVGNTLLPSLLTDFVWELLIKLSEVNYDTASEAASILKLTLEYHAQKVTMVSKIVAFIYKKLYENPFHNMKHAMLRVTALLTRTSPKKVIFQLMDYPVPADDTLILMWQAAGSEPSVAPLVLKTILLILKGKPGETEEDMEEKRRFSLDATNMMPVAASQALGTFLPVGSYKKAVAQFFPQLLLALMLQLFYSSQLRVMPQDRPLYARDALRALLNCSGLQEVDAALMKKNCWNQFPQALYHHHGVHLIAKTLSEFNFPQFPETLHYFYKISVEGPRRSEDNIVTIIFFTELLNNFFKDPFPEEFLVLYKHWIQDSNPIVSKLSLQKVANMAPVVNDIDNVHSLLMAILEAFLSKEKTVVIRALLTLRKLLGKLDRVTYSSLCTKIASSYCPLMDHSNGGIRSMAIRHFGELLRDMNQYTWMLNPLVLSVLVPLILFLEDKEIRVSKACKYTLRICASQLKWTTSTFLKDENYNFELVVLNICNHLVASHESYITDLISDTLGFLGSSRPYLRRGSVILVGYLAKLGAYLLLRDEIEVMIEVIEKTIRDEDPITQELAEITYGIFKEIAHKMTSSTIKQIFRRWFKFFYTKRLKPLYNWPKPQDSAPAELTKGNKEGLVEEEEEEILTKSYKSEEDLEQDVEDK